MGDADAQIVSPYTAGYTGYPYTAGYAGYTYTAGYAGYPYTAGYAGLSGLGYRYGKRSADAEADAQVLTTPYCWICWIPIHCWICWISLHSWICWSCWSWIYIWKEIC